MTDTHPQRVGLVIGSGSVKCSAAIGLWRVLQREGIRVDMVVGCSGGSIFSAFIALGYDAGAMEQMTLRLWARGITGKLYYPSLLRAALPRLFGFNQRFGLVDDRPIMAGLHEAFGDKTFADTQFPLYLAAADMQTGERVLLNKGRLVDAIRASIAIPILFRPWEVGGRLLIDGGTADPLPVSVAIREQCDIIIAMGFESPYTSHYGSLTHLVSQTTSIMINNLLKSTYAFYNLAHHAEIVPIIPELERRIDLGDAHQIPYLIEKGQQAAETQLPYLRRLLASTKP